MKKLHNILLNATIACNSLLAFLLVFESKLSMPAWLQVAGRLHPLVLHFPIVLIVLAALFQGYLLYTKKNPPAALSTMLLIAALVASGTALSGFILSKEEGYDANALNWHKWSGVIISFIMFLWALYYNRITANRKMTIATTAAAFVAIVITGHYGADITHGNNFLLAPVLKEEAPPQVLLEDALVFRDMVQPILKEKCMSCHNNSKAKGELIMETEAALLKGGKNGKLWDLSAPDFGLMMNRIHLPMQEKKHMPPTGKPQLTEQEIFILGQWIAKGASFDKQVIALAASDTLRMMAANQFSNIADEKYDFSSVSQDKISSLNTANRVVQSLAQQSPALVVTFYGRSQYQPAQLKDLLAVKEQIVSLNLNKMPVKDEELSTIASFKNLRKLNLSFTDITGAGLTQLKGLEHLQQLSVSGTKVTAKELAVLKSMKNLAAVYAWSTPIPNSERAGIEKTLSNARLNWGFRGDTIVMKLNAPILENQEQIISEPIELKLKHFLPGAIIRYTLDGSVPDSVQSPIFKAGIIINSQSTLKAKAFKEGWISSEVVEQFFYKNKYRPDTMLALLPPDNGYKGNGAATLYDNVKGDVNFRSGKWLGFKNNKMEMLLVFQQPISASSITLSSLVDIGSYIMPAQSIEIWGGTDKAQLRLLKKLAPARPTKEIPLYMQGIEASFAPTSVKYIKVIAVPVSVLPSWHRGKGDKGWVFADEIFVN